MQEIEYVIIANIRDVTRSMLEKATRDKVWREIPFILDRGLGWALPLVRTKIDFFSVKIMPFGKPIWRMFHRLSAHWRSTFTLIPLWQIFAKKFTKSKMKFSRLIYGVLTQVYCIRECRARAIPIIYLLINHNMTRWWCYKQRDDQGMQDRTRALAAALVNITVLI